MSIRLAGGLVLAALATAQEPEPKARETVEIGWRRTTLAEDLQGELQVAWTVALKSSAFGGACAADVDGDGKLELAFGTYFGDSRAIVLHGDGTGMWERDFGGEKGSACLDASFRFADLDHDGELELLVPVSNGCALHALDARKGTVRWTYQTGANDCIDSAAALAEVAGAPAIVFGSFQGRLHVVRNDGALLRRVPVGKGFVQTCPLVLDADGDGTADFIAGIFKGDNRLYCRSGKDDSELWHAQTAVGRELDLGIYHGPALGDLDGDGTPELVLCAYDGIVRCLRLKDGKELWRVQPGDKYMMAPPAIADVDGDGAPEVIIASQRVTVIERTGKVRYSTPIAPAASYLAADRGPSLADLDGDGKIDIAVLRADGWFGVLRGSTGELLWQLPAAKVTRKPVRGCMHGPLLADLDGDSGAGRLLRGGQSDRRPAPRDGGLRHGLPRQGPRLVHAAARPAEHRQRGNAVAKGVGCAHPGAALKNGPNSGRPRIPVSSRARSLPIGASRSVIRRAHHTQGNSQCIA